MLLIFIKNPQKGKVKTRLAKDIGDDEALAVYHRLLAHTARITATFQGDKTVFFSDFIPQAELHYFPTAQYAYALQQGEDLGVRMMAAFDQAFAQGASKALIIGSDCPELSAEILWQAWEALDEHEAVIGPAADGGYYLLGLRQTHPDLFLGKAWSHAQVGAEAMASMRALAWSVAQLPLLHDVDEVQDLVYLV
jgi:rSAM/selenodomain-associated transferase 1